MTELDVATLEFGDVFYGIKEINNALNRKKIHRIIDGEDWFKYDVEPATYKIVTYSVLGILTKHLEGEWEQHSDYELMTEIYVSCDLPKSAPQRFTMYVDDIVYGMNEYFVNKEDAQLYVDEKYELNKEADRK